MSGQQMAPQVQNAKSTWTRFSKSIIAILAPLWRPISWFWGILILGTLLSVLGNAAFTFLTTGRLEFTGTVTVLIRLNAHLALCFTMLIPVLLLTLCSYLAHHQQQRTMQMNHRAHDEALVVVAKGVQRALDELNAKPVI